jgi:hypothetical protein
MDIKACPRCGSRNITAGSMGSGILYGITSWKSECKHCGYQGEPLLFDTKEKYKKFCKELQENKNNGTPPACETEESEDTEQFTPKEQEIIDFAKETAADDTPSAEEPLSKDKSWTLEIGLSFIIAAIWTLLSVPGLLTILNTAMIILYAIFFFILATVIVLFIIIAIEYFAKKIRTMTRHKSNH